MVFLWAVTGAHVINAAHTCSYGALSYGSAASLTMKAHPTNGYTAAKVSGVCLCLVLLLFWVYSCLCFNAHSPCVGAASLAGNLHLASGSYAPADAITLMSCGSVSGTFASCTSDSATVKGQIHYTSTAVV